MKMRLQLLSYAIILFIIVTSCHKELENKNGYGYTAPPPPPRTSNLPPIIIDSLSGRTFQFDSLTWNTVYDEGMERDFTLVTTPPRPDLFSINRQFEVYLKIENSTDWFYAQRTYVYSPNDFYYWYYSNLTTLRILTNNETPDLVGKKVTVRIKFP
jgi:hypothetical protein